MPAAEVADDAKVAVTFLGEKVRVKRIVDDMLVVRMILFSVLSRRMRRSL